MPHKLRAALCAGALVLIVSACGLPSQSPPVPAGTAVIVPADLPTSTATIAVELSPTPTAIPSPTVTLTPIPSPTPTATSTPTVTATATAAPSPTPTPNPLWSLEDSENAREMVSATVDGVPVTVWLVTGGTLAEREWYAVERLTLNTGVYPDAAGRLAQAVLRAHWHAWRGQSPERTTVPFEEFTAALAQGEDRSYPVLASAADGPGSALVTVPVDPTLPLELFYTDEPGPIYVAEGSGFQFILNADGSLRLAIQVPPPVRRYYDRHMAEDPAGAQAYYTSYVFSPATALHVLSLSPEFQSEGVRLPGGAAQASRLALCGEFEDVDDLLAPCGAEGTYETAVRAMVRTQ